VKQLYIIFNKSELRKPRYIFASLILLTIVEFRRNSLTVFISYSVISLSCANDILFWIGLKKWLDITDTQYLSSTSAGP